MLNISKTELAFTWSSWQYSGSLQGSAPPERQKWWRSGLETESVCGREPWPEYRATIQTKFWVKISNNHLEWNIYSQDREILTKCPSLAATKHTRPPLKNVPFSEPKADNAAATDMFQPQLPNTLFLVKQGSSQKSSFRNISNFQKPFATSRKYITGQICCSKHC